MDRRPLALVFAGTLPVLLLSAMTISSTIHEVRDPCRTWGATWGPVQSGGGTSTPGATGPCAQGTSWTTESKAYAVWRIAWLPLGAIAAAALGYAAIARGSAVAGALAVAILLAISFPLTIGATVFIAALPALLVACALRVRGLHRAPPTIGVGIAACALPVALFGIGLARGGMPIGAFVIAGLYWVPIVAAGLVLLLPSAAAPRPSV